MPSFASTRARASLVSLCYGPKDRPPIKRKRKVWCTRFPARSAHPRTSAKQNTIKSGFASTKMMCATSITSAARLLNTVTKVTTALTSLIRTSWTSNLTPARGSSWNLGTFRPRQKTLIGLLAHCQLCMWTGFTTWQHKTTVEDAEGIVHICHRHRGKRRLRLLSSIVAPEEEAEQASKRWAPVLGIGWLSYFNNYSPNQTYLCQMSTFKFSLCLWGLVDIR